MEESTRFHNQHNIYVKTGLATKTQLENSVVKFRNELHKMFPTKNYDKCEILVNLVTAKNQSMGYAYLWVQNPEVYFILCGFNPDGSDRVEEFIEAPKIEKDDDLDLDLETMDLNDIISEKQKAEGVKIYKPIEPILRLPGYEYTPEQAKTAYEELVNEEAKLAETEGREPNTIEAPKCGFFECSRSDTTTIGEDLSYNTLWGKIPEWVTKNMIHSTFSRYAESPDPKYFKIDFGQVGKDIHLPKHREVIIDYGNTRRGIATFALQMTRKTKFVNPTTKEEAECVFNYYRPRKDFHNHNNHNSDNKVKKNNNFLNRNNERNFLTRNIR